VTGPALRRSRTPVVFLSGRISMSVGARLIWPPTQRVNSDVCLKQFLLV